MSIKWTGVSSETGILRKSETKEKKEELFVFGYSCKLFRDDDKALLIDQGKHLIPWMGDETLKIDRYDARGALHDLSACEAPPGGYDWRVELTRTELDVEQLCDDERYRALHTDEDEEEMYKEEELKRLHAAGYGQVGFNYDTPEEKTTQEPVAEVEEPFEAPPELKHQLPDDMVLPESLKQHAIIEKTAKFIASQGVQMEILIKAKQGDNPQFKFLNKDSHLHPYYLALIGLVKAGKWPEKKVEVVEENQNEMNNEYLHPSLASTIIESAPSIPSIHYKPSADCDYTMLISKMRGSAAAEDEPAPGEVAPPGTEPLPPPHISRAPVIYSRPRDPAAAVPPAPYCPVTPAAPPAPPAPPALLPPSRSTGLSLMSHYNTDSDSEDSDFEDSSSSEGKDKPVIVEPPDEVKVVIDKMAAYVARNGDEFAEIVRAKNDPRFTFLEPGHAHHAYYTRLMAEKRAANGQNSQNSNPPVSFSIKKHKEPDPILPKPALPYESSSDEGENKEEKTEEPPKEMPKTNIPQIYSTNNVPPVVVYKMEGTITNNLPMVKAIEAKPQAVQKPIPMETIGIQKVPPTIVEHALVAPLQLMPEISRVEMKEKTPEVYRKDKEKERKDKERSSSSREKRKHRDKKKDYRSKSESRDLRRIEDKDRRKERDDRERKRKKESKEAPETEIISLVDNSDEMIDLTDELSDSKGESASRGLGRRAAELLQRAGVNPAAAHNSSSLASAMVDTLESLRKKKDEERRRREKRRKKEKKDYGDDDRHRRSKRKYDKSSDEDGSDYDGSRRKKRKKERKHSKNKKKRREESDCEEDQPINIDLTNTLKELRNASPTKELGLQEVRRETPEDDILRRKKKKEREYSEGEWSSDSDDDSLSTASQESSDEEGSDYDGSRRKKRKKERKHSKNKKKRREESDCEEDQPINIDLTNTLKELRNASPTKELGLQEVRRETPEDDILRRKKKKEREYSEGEWSSDSDDDSLSTASQE